MKTSSSIQDNSMLTSLMTVSMTLCNVLYISYAVQARSLRALLPEFLTLATLDEDITFLSVVILQCKKVRLWSLPFARFNYNQLNLRTYIKDPLTGNHGVYFLKSGVTSRFISLATRSLGIPWQYINLGFQITNDRNNLLSYEAVGHWQENFNIIAKEVAAPSSKLTLFADVKSAVDYIVRPLIGFFGDFKRVGRFTIWHQDIMPQLWQLNQIDFPSLGELGIIEEVTKPHSVFFLARAEFSIYMPPTFVNGKRR